MTLLQIPTPNEPNVTQITELDGRNYQFTWWINDRNERLFFDLAAEDGTPLLMGCTISLGVDLLAAHRYNTALPPGPLVALPLGADTSAPMTWPQFNARCALLYNSVTEIAS